MKKLTRSVLLAISFLTLSDVAQAAMSPLGVSILPPVQFPPRSFTVTGVRASALWGQHREVYGIDLGLLGNVTDLNFVGIAASGVFNLNKGQSTIIGLQAAGLTNINVNKARIYGVQIAAGLNSNQAESRVVGFQIAAANYSPFTKVLGVQAGIYNRANTVTGFQIGLINDTDVLHGIQIGLINFHRKGLFSVAPILNVGF